MKQVMIEENYQPGAPVYQENRQIGFFLRAPFQFQPAGTENLQSMCLPSTPQPHLQSCTPQCYGEVINMVPNTFMNPLPGNSGNLTAGSSLPQEVAEEAAHSSLESVETVEAGLKRAHRLIRNRDASRECRRKKKEYVKCLEDRLDMLENLNKSLIDEVKALKDVYWHKVQNCARKYRIKKKDHMDGLERHNTLLETENEMLKAELRRLMTMDVRTFTLCLTPGPS